MIYKKWILTLVLYTTFVNAQTIHVKYRDTPIDVDNGHFSKVQLKGSSLVKEMYYDNENSYLLVQLKHRFYHYCKIPNNIITDWKNASSLGRYYIANIKGNYDCRINPIPKYK